MRAVDEAAEAPGGSEDQDTPDEADASSSRRDEPGAPALPASGSQRIDKWLWFARVVKSRTLAAGLVTAGKVRINRAKIDKPSHALKVGDAVTVAVGRKVRVLRVLAPGVRRGPASEAQTLYEDLSPPAAAPAGRDGGRAAAGDSATGSAPAAQAATREAGAGRPTKRERRETDRLRGRR